MGIATDVNCQSSKKLSLLLVLFGFAIAVLKSIFRIHNTQSIRPPIYWKQLGSLNNSKDSILDLTTLMGDKKDGLVYTKRKTEV